MLSLSNSPKSEDTDFGQQQIQARNFTERNQPKKKSQFFYEEQLKQNLLNYQRRQKKDLLNKLKQDMFTVNLIDYVKSNPDKAQNANINGQIAKLTSQKQKPLQDKAQLKIQGNNNEVSQNSKRKFLELPESQKKKNRIKPKSFNTNLLEMFRQRPSKKKTDLSSERDSITDLNSFQRSCLDILQMLNSHKNPKQINIDQIKKRMQRDLIKQLQNMTPPLISPYSNEVNQQNNPYQFVDTSIHLTQSQILIDPPPTPTYYNSPQLINFDLINQTNHLEEEYEFKFGGLTSPTGEQTIKYLQQQLNPKAQAVQGQGQLGVDNFTTFAYQLSPSKLKSPQPSSSIPTATFPTSMNMSQSEPSILQTSQLEKSINEQGQTQLNQYIVKQLLGSGSFGKVKRAYDTQKQIDVAIKITQKKSIRKQLFSLKVDNYTLLEREIAIMKKLNHPNIVRLLEVIDDSESNKIYLVMEFMDKGSLSKQILSEDKARQYFSDLICGLDYLHNHVNIIHRDIKPDNLLIDKNDKLKIADFGVSHIMDQSEFLTCQEGTIAFMAPEMFSQKNYKGKPLDVWASGITLYQMVVGKLPFENKNAAQLRKDIQQAQYDLPQNLSEELRDLIQKILEPKPDKRLTILQIMAHPWVNKYGQLVNSYGEEVVVTNEEIQRALTKINIALAIKMVTRIIAKAKKSKLNVSQRGSK